MSKVKQTYANSLEFLLNRVSADVFLIKIIPIFLIWDLLTLIRDMIPKKHHMFGILKFLVLCTSAMGHKLSVYEYEFIAALWGIFVTIFWCWFVVISQVFGLFAGLVFAYDTYTIFLQIKSSRQHVPASTGGNHWQSFLSCTQHTPCMTTAYIFFSFVLQFFVFFCRWQGLDTPQ